MQSHVWTLVLWVVLFVGGSCLAHKACHSVSAMDLYGIGLEGMLCGLVSNGFRQDALVYWLEPARFAVAPAPSDKEQQWSC